MVEEVVKNIKSDNAGQDENLITTLPRYASNPT